MAKLTQQEIDTIKLVNRSPDVGQGWRHHSDILWVHFLPLYEKRPELFELLKDEKCVRLTERAKIILEYL